MFVSATTAIRRGSFTRRKVRAETASDHPRRASVLIAARISHCTARGAVFAAAMIKASEKAMRDESFSLLARTGFDARA